MILQKFTTARKSGNIILTYWKLFSSDTHQSMKTSDNDLKVNLNLYPDNTLTASGYKFRFTFRSLSDVFILWWVSDEKSFQYVKIMLPLFRATVKNISKHNVPNYATHIIAFLCMLLPPYSPYINTELQINLKNLLKAYTICLILLEYGALLSFWTSLQKPQAFSWVYLYPTRNKLAVWFLSRVFL